MLMPIRLAITASRNRSPDPPNAATMPAGAPAMRAPTPPDRLASTISRTLAALLLILAIPDPSRAQTPPAMVATWSRFQAALQANSPEQLARIIRFPLDSNEFGGPIANLSVLRSRFGLIFTPTMRHCLLHQTPSQQIIDGRIFYEAFCDKDRYPIRFVFERIGSDIRWTSIDNINE